MLSACFGILLFVLVEGGLQILIRFLVLKTFELFQELPVLLRHVDYGTIVFEPRQKLQLKPSFSLLFFLPFISIYIVISFYFFPSRLALRMLALCIRPVFTLGVLGFRCTCRVDQGFHALLGAEKHIDFVVELNLRRVKRHLSNLKLLRLPDLLSQLLFQSCDVSGSFVHFKHLTRFLLIKFIIHVYFWRLWNIKKVIFMDCLFGFVLMLGLADFLRVVSLSQ